MEKFYIDLDKTGQTIVSHSRRRIFLAVGLFWGVAALVMLISGFLNGGWELLLFAYNAFIYIFLAAICISLFQGKNLLSLPLGNFFSLDRDSIRYRFSAFSPTTTIEWSCIRFAEIQLFTVFFQTGDSVLEINLEEIRHLPTRRLIKEKIRQSISQYGITRLAQTPSLAVQYAS